MVPDVVEPRLCAAARADILEYLGLARPALAHGLFDAWGLARACLPPPSTYFGGALLARVFALDVTVCPACGGRLRLIAALTHPASVRRDLQGVGLPTEPPPLIPLESPTPARGGLRRITYDSTLHRSRSLLVGSRPPRSPSIPGPSAPTTSPFVPRVGPEPQAQAPRKGPHPTRPEGTSL